jgi:rod shape determining protein RodA
MAHSDFVRQMPLGGNASLQKSLWHRLHLDPALLFLLLIISGFGLFVLYSASGQSVETVKRQGAFFMIAYTAMFFVAQINVDMMRRWSPFVYVLGVLLLVAVLFGGTVGKGAQRWLQIGGFRFQPSEIMKLIMPLATAWFLSSRILPPRIRVVLISLAIAMVPAVLIFKQPDLGTAILVAASGLFCLFFAGLGWRYVIAAGGLAAIAAPIMWFFVMHDYQKRRVLTLFDPESDRLGSGWNIIQSMTAIGSGGIEGKGWLQGSQSALNFLPESHTDFIIAVLAEEFGLLGVIALLLMYSLILVRGIVIGMSAQSTFARLVAGAITSTFFVYVLVNMGMVSGILPVVGVPLPLVSQGGTSLVTLMMGFGILMAISTEQRRLAH